ncbi:hypothetical protein BLNAU_9150 [Blattamonas nauphoetae]|uniref:Uncharacterized protein n=1 Tax=Blattamonas nauphoetae TaxID=2049346 RepID=A0ABQ9XWC9_9EUKA|nr:hypothetical protein BLNAU_9150 [Blattamonas nauphoetae]
MLPLAIHHNLLFDFNFTFLNVLKASDEDIQTLLTSVIQDPAPNLVESLRKLAKICLFPFYQNLFDSAEDPDRTHIIYRQNGVQVLMSILNRTTDSTIQELILSIFESLCLLFFEVSLSAFGTDSSRLVHRYMFLFPDTHVSMMKNIEPYTEAEHQALNQLNNGFVVVVQIFSLIQYQLDSGICQRLGAILAVFDDVINPDSQFDPDRADDKELAQFFAVHKTGKCISNMDIIHNLLLTESFDCPPSVEDEIAFNDSSLDTILIFQPIKDLHVFCSYLLNEAVFILSNLSGGLDEHALFVLNNLLPDSENPADAAIALLLALYRNCEQKYQNEILIFFVNLACSPHILPVLVENNIILGLFARSYMINLSDPQTLENLLSIVAQIVQPTVVPMETIKLAAKQIVEANVLKVVKMCQDRNEPTLKGKAERILTMMEQLEREELCNFGLTRDADELDNPDLSRFEKELVNPDLPVDDRWIHNF